MIDSHIHLHQYDQRTIGDNIQKWREEGIDHVVAVSTDLRTTYITLELKQKYGDFIFACAGFHPEQEPPQESELIELFSIIRENQDICAIGEVGLPYYERKRLLEKYSEETFIEILCEFLKLSSDLSLPVALHAVYGEAEKVLHLLRKYQVKKAHFHWLKAPFSTVRQIIENGYYVSVTPEVCYRLRDQKLAEQIPLNRLLLETDGPWPYKGPFENIKTTPIFIKEIGSQMAKLKRRPWSEVMKVTADNAKKLYYDNGGRT